MAIASPPDASSTNDADWDPWQTNLPPIGSIFILWLSQAHHRPITADTWNNRFKLLSLDSDGDHFRMEKYSSKKWDPGHLWQLSFQPQFRVLRVTPVKTITAQASATGCVCHRCNARNQWAVANLPDGRYICYECR